MPYRYNVFTGKLDFVSLETVRVSDGDNIKFNGTTVAKIESNGNLKVTGTFMEGQSL